MYALVVVVRLSGVALISCLVLPSSAGPEVTTCEVSEAADKVIHLPALDLAGCPPE